ncbi:hypothetical protein KIPB_003749 [Kipferlia bialata]|uniref:Uncharacterized protein n=1 Tax=Kipferlia bialata TaxID=797122 RepID=A0A9K3GHN9_9EUKA|nr:hypothetical protein KIPB_003749 [Kipferlia bialata]|eukprot:g3749.t1
MKVETPATSTCMDRDAPVGWERERVTVLLISFFGHALSVSDTWAAVTAEGEDTGAVLMYHRDANDWVYHSSLPVPDVDDIAFGLTVAIDGDWTAVTSTFTTDYTQVIVHLFHFNSNGVWVLSDTIPSPGPQVLYGQSPAMGGGLLVTGYPDADDGSGMASVYRLVDGSYTWEQDIRGGPYSNDSIGNGNAVAVSADGTKIAMGSYIAGQVYIFEREADTPGGEWVLSSTLPVDCYEETTLSFSDDGSVVVVGCQDYTSETPYSHYAGQVQVMDRDMETGEYSVVSTLNGDNTAFATFGAAVALTDDGDTLAVGAPMDNMMYIYTRRKGATAYALADTEYGLVTDPYSCNDELGTALGVAGATLLAGMPGAEGYTGRVGVFDLGSL